MQRLDRLVWAGGISFTIHGLLLGIRWSDPVVAADVAGILPPGARLSSEEDVEHLYSVVVPGPSRRKGVRGLYLAYSDSTRISRQEQPADLLADLESHLHLLVAEMARDRVFVHAGAVALDGRALLLPGRSFGGKSTLVRELGRLGATYLSDEFAVLSPEGLVYPFARPLSMRSSLGEPRGRKVPAEALGLRVQSGPCRVGAVVITRYEEDAVWAPRALSPAEVVLGLLEHTVAARRDPERILATLERVAGNVSAVASVRPEAGLVAPGLLEMLERRPAGSS